MVEIARNTECYERRFGVTAVEMGFITAEQLVTALKVQVEEDLQGGHHRLLGQILREMQAMTAEDVEAVLTYSLKLRALVQ